MRNRNILEGFKANSWNEKIFENIETTNKSDYQTFKPKVNVLLISSSETEVTSPRAHEGFPG